MYILNVVKKFLENRSSCSDDDISKVLAGSNQRNIIRAEEQDDVLKLEEKTKVELGERTLTRFVTPATPLPTLDFLSFLTNSALPTNKY